VGKKKKRAGKKPSEKLPPVPRWRGVIDPRTAESMRNSRRTKSKGTHFGLTFWGGPMI